MNCGEKGEWVEWIGEGGDDGVCVGGGKRRFREGKGY